MHEEEMLRGISVKRSICFSKLCLKFVGAKLWRAGANVFRQLNRADKFWGTFRIIFRVFCTTFRF